MPSTALRRTSLAAAATVLALVGIGATAGTAAASGPGDGCDYSTTVGHAQYLYGGDTYLGRVDLVYSPGCRKVVAHFKGATAWMNTPGASVELQVIDDAPDGSVLSMQGDRVSSNAHSDDYSYGVSIDQDSRTFGATATVDGCVIYSDDHDFNTGANSGTGNTTFHC
ncbi:hypothetical protein [Kitasatospora viridis]|uniref:DUF2690 domain-containing protein n=1 Tax=Kitasatospora viridis TaxID=281105 RepID=A0A561UNA1_9ACTN|nr:hypothetical protein [Kitasatospora viridis]TWG00846.1 hypothetical protein FHX73_114726 [Kitasatospora viridis]